MKRVGIQDSIGAREQLCCWKWSGTRMTCKSLSGSSSLLITLPALLWKSKFVGSLINSSLMFTCSEGAAVHEGWLTDRLIRYWSTWPLTLCVCAHVGIDISLVSLLTPSTLHQEVPAGPSKGSDLLKTLESSILCSAAKIIQITQTTKCPCCHTPLCWVE